MKMKNVDVEQKYAWDVWYVLQKIKDNHLRRVDENGVIRYSIFLYPEVRNIHIPNSSDEQYIIENLKKDKAIVEVRKRDDFEVRDNKDNLKSAGITLYLKVNNQIFDECYAKQKKIIINFQNGSEQCKIVFIKKDSDLHVEFFSSLGNSYQGKFRARTNPYLLLEFLSQKPGQVFSAEELEKILNPSQKSTPDRRIRDTIQVVRSELKLQGDDDLFIVHKGFGIKPCDIEIKN